MSGIDSVLREEGASSEPATTAVPSSKAVTVAIPTGRLVQSGDRASALLPDPKLAGTSGTEAGPSRRKRLVASSTSKSSAFSSSEEEEEEDGEML
ncbi:hypothetical protein AAC387_Pa02g1269 [Persea americana]